MGGVSKLITHLRLLDVLNLGLLILEDQTPHQALSPKTSKSPDPNVDPTASAPVWGQEFLAVVPPGRAKGLLIGLRYC